MKRSLFSRNLKYLRKLNDLTQAEMPARCGIQASTWSNYENDVTEPDLGSLLKISKLFEVSTDDLLELDFEAVQANMDRGVVINKAKSTGKSTGISTANSQFEDSFNKPNDQNREVEVASRVMLSQMKMMDDKIDLIRVLLEKLTQDGCKKARV